MGLMKKLTSVVVTAGLLFGLVGTAFAGYPADVQPSANRMQQLKIVQGRPDGSLGLNDEITRAELVTIIVRAFGKSEDAKFLKGAPAFPDSASHWASGEIALAKNIIEANGFTMGMPDGKFQPDGKVTAAQAVAFLMKFLGAPADASQTWPNDYLNGAVASGLITADDKGVVSGVANANATRGLVFYLADKAFSGYKLADGKTVYTKYVKPVAPTVTVDAIAPTTDATVTVTGSVSADATAVYVGSTTNAATVTNGKFSASVNLAMGENSISVMATDVAGNVTTQVLKVTRTVGAAAAIEAPASLTVAAGASADLAIAVKDAKGNVISDATPEVTSDLGTYAAGKFTAGTKATTGTITVKLGDLAPATVNVTVNPAALAKIVVTPATADLSAGTSQKFSATGADAFGNAVAVSGVTWTASKGIMGPDGTYGATADAAGTVTVTATANGFSGTAAVTVFGVPSKVQIAAPASMVADDDSETTLTATVLDQNGNVARNYNDYVTFSSTNTNVAVISTTKVEAVNGVATTTVKSTKTKGTTVLSATAEGLDASSVNYTTVAQALTSISMTVSPGTLDVANGSRGTLKFKMLDQNGKDLLTKPSSNLQVKVETSDKLVAQVSGLSSQTYTLDAVSKSFTGESGIFGMKARGTATISATVTSPASYTSIPVTSASVSTTNVGPASAFTIDPISSKKASETVTVTFRAVDDAGNQITTGEADLTTGQYTVTVKDSDGVTVTPTVTKSAVAYGKGTFTINWATLDHSGSTATAGDYTVKVSSATLNVTAATATGTVTPDVAKKLSISASPRIIQADGNSNATVTVKVKDAYNNTVTDGSYEVKVTRTGSKTTSADSEEIVTTSGGVATLQVTSTKKQGTDYFQASSTEGKLSATAVQGTSVRTAYIGQPTALQWVDKYGTAKGTAYSGNAGEDTTVYVGVVDDNPLLVSADNGTPVSVEVFDGKDSLGVFTGTTANGIAAVNVNVTKASTGFKLVATSGGLTKVSTADKLVVAAGPAKSISVTSDRESVATGGVTANIKATLKDEYGNSTPADGAVTLYAQASPETTFGAIDDDLVTSKVGAGLDYSGWWQFTIPDGQKSQTITFTSNSKVGSVTISVEGADLTEGSVDLDTVSVGAADELVVDTPDAVTVSDATADDSLMEITAKLVDSNGNVLTDDSASQITITPDADFPGTEIYVDDGLGGYAAYNAGTNNVVDRGEITFYVLNPKAGEAEFTLAATNKWLDTVKVKGTFNAGEVDTAGTPLIVETSDPATIGEGGQVVGVTVKVADEFGNAVTDFSGTVTFEITSGSDYATLQSTEASVVDGEATVLAKSKSLSSAGGLVKITASCDVDNDGTDEESAETTAFTVELAAPTVASVKASADLAAMDAGSVIRVTFNEDTNEPNLDATDLSFAQAGDTLGATAPTFEWEDAKTLVITLGSAPTVTGNVSLKETANLADLNGNAEDADLKLFDNTDLVDTIGPKVVSVTASATDLESLVATDTLTVVFDEDTDQPVLTAASFTVAAGDTLGNATVTWTNAKTMVIHIGATLPVIRGDVKTAAASTIEDVAGNDFGTGALFSVDDITFE